MVSIISVQTSNNSSTKPGSGSIISFRS